MIDTDTARRCNTTLDVSRIGLKDCGDRWARMFGCAQWRLSMGNVGGYRIGTGEGY